MTTDDKQAIFERIHPLKFLANEAYLTGELPLNSSIALIADASLLQAADEFRDETLDTFKLYLDALSALPDELVDTAIANLLWTSGAFSSVDDQWTTEEHAMLSTKLFDLISRKASSKSIQTALFGFLDEVKPVFRLQNAAVSDKGLPVRQRGQKSVPFGQQPWKSDTPEANAVFSWAVCRLDLDEMTIQRIWHLLIPPLLTIVDDYEPRYKRRGITVCYELLSNQPFIAMMIKSGLDGVFYDAISKGLMFVREDDTGKLLDITLRTLLKIVDLPSQKGKLEAIFNDGMLLSFAYHGDNITTAIILLRALPGFIDRLGITTVKYLKDLVPLLCDKMAFPSVHSRVNDLVKAALVSMQVLIKTCWPRIPRYGGMILAGLATAWTHAIDAAEKDEFLLCEIHKVYELLLLVAGDDLKADVEALSGVGVNL